MANEVEIPLKLSGIEKIKAELKDLRQSIIEVGGEAAMAELVKRAAELSKEIELVNDQVAEMSKGSGLNKVSEAFKDIKDDINSINFDKAAKSMDKLSDASNETARSFDKGATFAQRYGEQLQPLTTRIGEAEDRLYELALAGDKTSQEYQDLLETVAKYRKVQIETDQVVDGASQTMAQKLGGSLGGVTSAFELAQGAAGAFGASGEAIEKSLLKVQSAAAIAQGFQGIKEAVPSIKALSSSFAGLGKTILANPIFLIGSVIAAIVVGIGIFLKKIGVLDKMFNTLMAPIKALIESFKQLTEWLGLSTAASDDAAEKVKSNNEKIIASSKERAEQQSKGIDQEIQLAQSLGKETTKLEIEKTKVTERESKRRLEQTQKDLKELANKRGVLADQERARLKKQLKDENEIIRQAQVDRKVIRNKAAKEEADEAKAAAEKAAEEAKAKASENAKAYAAARAAIQKEIAAANKLVIDSGKTQSQKEIDDTKAKYAALIAEAKKYKQDITALEAARDLEINNIRKAGADELTKIETKKSDDIVKGLVDTRVKTLQVQGEGNMESFQQLQEYNAAVKEADQSLFDARFGMARGLITAIGELAGENKKVANALFVVDKALAIGEVVVNTQREISGYLSNPTWSLLPDGGAALKTAAIAGAKIRAATSIGTIVASSIGKFMGGGSASIQTPSVSNGGGGASGSSVPSFVPGNLFGQGNAANNVTAPSGMESNQNITVTAVVSETEMTSTQNKVNKIMKNSVL